MAGRNNLRGEKMLYHTYSRTALLAVVCLFLSLAAPITGQAELNPRPGQVYSGAFTGAASVSPVSEAVAQIQERKSTLSRGQGKLGTDLLRLSDASAFSGWITRQEQAHRMESLDQFIPMTSLPDADDQIQEGSVYVYVYLRKGYNTSLIDPFAREVTDRDEVNGLAAAWVQVKNLENLAAQDGVRAVRSVMPPVTNAGSVTTEGDIIHRTADVRAAYAQSGAGMKVGIISDGVNSRATAQASGDLPADGSGLTVVSDTVGGDEGTAMLEIVHDLVPSADLYFHDCGTNVLAFNAAIDSLVAAGCNVICDDTTWVNEPFFEDGTVGGHVSSLLAGQDIIYVSSAGDAGSAHYQGNYCNLTGTYWHDFSAGTSGDKPFLYLNMPAGSSVTVVLQWDDPFGAAVNDYDLFLLDVTTDTQQAGSWNTQDGDDDPLETFQFTATTSDDYYIIVDQWAGSTEDLEIFIYPENGCSVYSDNITPADSIFGHPAVSGVLSVGAISAADPGNDNIESFSSRGPSTIRYPSPESRAKPDICGIDGVSVTGAGGFPTPFYGTSAAAAHVAAVCAQLWGRFPGKTGNQIRGFVTATAMDLGTLGVDNTFGYGRADALNAFKFFCKYKNLIEWNGNLVADFGARGMWYYDGSTWNWMTNDGNVGQMLIWDGKLVADFGVGKGLQYYDGSWHWMSNKSNPNLMVSWDNGTTEVLVVDFGAGKRIYTYNGTWNWFNNKDNVADMTVWNNKLIVDFGAGRGLYNYDGVWNWISNKDDVAAMMIWDNGSTEVLVVDFGGGRYIYTYNGTWTFFSADDDVNDMAVWNHKLVVDFGGGRGMKYYDTAWHMLSILDDSSAMVSWSGGSKLAVDYGGGRNMYNFDGSWHFIKDANDVPEMLAWDNRLVVDFGSGTGVYNYLTDWTIMKGWSTAD